MVLEYSSLLIILAITAFHEEGITAVPQDPQGLFGTVEDTVGDVLPNLTCNALIFTVNQTIKAHPDWRNWLEQVRSNETDFIEKCANKLDDGEVKSFLIDQKDFMNCPESHRTITIVATVFIVAFILALIGLIVLTVLYYRK